MGDGYQPGAVSAGELEEGKEIKERELNAETRSTQRREDAWVVVRARNFGFEKTAA